MKQGIFAVVAGPRLGGKCLKENTLVHTTRGPKKIQEVKVGDEVFGFNADGSISPSKVLAVVDQGRQRVVDLIYSNKVIATATAEHRWWTTKSGRNDDRVGVTTELSYRRLGRRYAKHTGGDKTVPYAYALGSLLGNGCSTCGSSKRYDYSSACEAQVAAVARQLNTTYKKTTGENYTWQIVRGDAERALYDLWCDGKLAHQKTIDLDEVATWDRGSQVALLAGLIDTDGSIGLNRRAKSFTLSFSSTSESLATAVSSLILGLFQCAPTQRLSVRDDKRDCWDVRVNSGFHVERILRELDEWLVVPHKKWTPAMVDVPHQRNPESLTVHLGSEYEAQCWDLMIDNDTSLYLLTNEGLITHNTTLAGTLKGNTLLLQAAVMETGSRSALALAKRNGNNLEVRSFDSIAQLHAEVVALKEGKGKWDHVYIDGLSAITDMRFESADIQALTKRNVWDAFLKLGQDISALLLLLKSLTSAGKNVFLTCALKVEAKGNTLDVELETKGKMAVTSVTKLGEAVLTVMQVPVEGGGTKRVLLTKSADSWPGRVDGVLDSDNPGMVDADLSIVLEMMGAPTGDLKKTKEG